MTGFVPFPRNKCPGPKRVSTVWGTLLLINVLYKHEVYLVAQGETLVT